MWLQETLSQLHWQKAMPLKLIPSLGLKTGKIQWGLVKIRVIESAKKTHVNFTVFAV